MTGNSRINITCRLPNIDQSLAQCSLFTGPNTAITSHKLHRVSGLICRKGRFMDNQSATRADRHVTSNHFRFKFQCPSVRQGYFCAITRQCSRRNIRADVYVFGRRNDQGIGINLCLSKHGACLASTCSNYTSAYGRVSRDSGLLCSEINNLLSGG